MDSSMRRLFWLAALLWAAVTPAAAQTAPAPPPTVGFQDGFFLQANPDNRLQFGVVLQTDGRFSTDSPSPITNTFTIRKARPVLVARIARYFDARLMTEFAGGSPTVLDAYFDVRFSSKFRLRSGKDKTPVGYELLQPDPFLLFPERALASN